MHRTRTVTAIVGAAVILAASVSIGGAANAVGGVGADRGVPELASVVAPARSAWDLGPVILDEDMDQLGDGAQSMFMLLQAHAHLLGITSLSGNYWEAEGTAYALSQQSLIGAHVPVFRGANVPLSGDRQGQLPLEEGLFGPSDYVGAWSHPDPPSYRKLAEPPYGGYSSQKPAGMNAAEFIVRMAHRYPHQLSIIAAGPLTNIALALELDPSITQLVKQIVYMGGAVTVPGNTTPAAEFNIWFDPVGAKIVVNAPWRKFIEVPLDLTNQVLYGKAQYDQIIAGRPTPIKKEFKALQGPGWASHPDQQDYVYDETATAIFLDPSLVTSSTTEYFDVDTNYGLDFGRTLGYTGHAGPASAQKVEVVNHIDIPAFFKLYISLMRRG